MSSRPQPARAAAAFAARVFGAVVGLALTIGAAALSQAQTPEPPLGIHADNMTGSHGDEGDIVLLNGHVRITRDRALLTADHGRYLRTAGLIELTGSVKMVDTTTTLTCDQATYSQNDDVLHVSGHVTVIDRDAVLHAPFGTYFRKAGRLIVTGGVQGKDRDQRLECDEATYERDSMVVHARGHVKGFDDPHKLELGADAIDFDRRSREAVATGDPKLTAIDEHGRHTVLRGLRMRMNTESRLAEAMDSVTIVSDTLRARGDYARFDDVAGRGWLLGSPRVWDNETAMTGDSLEFWSEKRVLQKVRMRGHAAIDYAGIRPNTVGESSRLYGDQVDVFFRDQQIDSLVAIGAARNEYQSQARPGKTAERNGAHGDTVVVYFRDRKLDEARVLGGASGEYHPATDASDTAAVAREVVRYDAPRIEFHVPKSRIVLDRAAHLTYGDMELRAKRVEYDVDDQTLTAVGRPVLHEKGDEVTGQLMTYDMASRVGTIYKAETAYEKGLYHGDRIRKVGNNVLDVLNGSYSTCDLESPHYHFASHYMKIYLKDKLVAKPVVFYLRHVPIFALPFYVFPIKPGRHSGFLFPQTEFGLNNRAGQFVRNAGYYWAPNDYFDLTASGDYSQADPSYIVRADGVYKVQYLLSGDAAASYAKNERLKRQDWDLNAHHSQQLGPRTNLLASGEFISSRDYNAGNFFGRPLAQALNRFLTSNIALSHAADWASINVLADRRQDLDADASIQDPDGEGPLHGPPVGTQAPLSNLTESLPSLGLSFPTRTLGSIGWLKHTGLEKPLSTLYFSFDSHYLAQRDSRSYVAGQRFFVRDTVTDSTTSLAERVNVRNGMQSNVALSDSRRLFGWINFQPRLQSSIAVFDHDELGHKVVPAEVWSASATTGTTFYGTFNPHIGSLVGVRHILVPSVTFNYSPEFPSLTFRDSSGTVRNRFASFGGIGVSGFRTESFSFNLDQRLQAKVQRKDDVLRLDNLLSWGLSGNYDLLWREHHQKHALGLLNSGVLLQPPGLVSASLQFQTDPYSPRPTRQLTGSSGLTFSSHSGSGGSAVAAATALPVDQTRRSRYDVGEANFRDLWALSLAYSYSGGYPDGGSKWSSQQTGNLVTHYQVSPAWTVDFSASYDITNRRLLTHRFGLTRDLHCWTASFTRDFSPYGQAEYYLKLQVKDQREVFFERGSRVSTLGGLQ